MKYCTQCYSVQCDAVHHLESYVSELGTGQGRDLTAPSHKVAPCALQCTAVHCTESYIEATLNTLHWTLQLHNTHCKPKKSEDCVNPTTRTAMHLQMHCTFYCTAVPAVPASTVHFALPCSAMDILHPHIYQCTFLHSDDCTDPLPPSRLALTLPGPGALYPSLCRGLNSNVALQSTVLQAPIFQLCNTLLDLLGILEVHSAFLYPFQCCISAALQPWLESSLCVSCSALSRCVCH